MCFDRNIDENRNIKYLGCDYFHVQWCMKLTLSLMEKITKQTHLQDQKLLLTSNNEFESRTPYETNREGLLEVNVDHKSQQNEQYYMGVQDTFCLSSSYTQAKI